MSQTRNRRTIIAGLLVVAALVLLTPAGLAQDGGPTDNEVNAIAKQLYCPVCENVPLDVCPTLACQQWRATIREKLAEGWDEEQIKGYFVEQYGDRVLAAPPPSGFNWLVYVLPPLAILIGAFVLFRAVRSWRQAAAAQGTLELQSSDDPYLQRLEDELQRRA
jgi:cytochrome c-type biogenesis protein CcmH